MARQVLFVGGIPLRPARAVFEMVAGSLGSLVPRIPDGDQNGWIVATVNHLAANQALERTGSVEISRGGADVPTFGLRPGRRAADLQLGPYGYADVAADSYRAFRELRDGGKVPSSTRFQVTMPGPGTSAFMVGLPAEELLPIAREALAAEVRELAQNVPPQDLAVQLDIAMEAEHEEYRRRPDAFQTPIHEFFDWTQEQMAESAAWLADSVPEEAELGFHICSIWHHYQPGGQDNAVLVDTANALAERVGRRIDYIHLPTIPEHDVADFAPLMKLRLAPETKVYLGVIHRSDGIQGARRRIAAAQTALSDFGVASFCGFGNPITSRAQSPIRAGQALHQDMREGAAWLDEIMALHRDVALLGDA